MTEPQRAALQSFQSFVDATMPTTAGSAAPEITVEQLRAVMPNLPLEKAKEYVPLMNRAMAEAQINTPKRQAAFLAQIAHESIELTRFVEKSSGEQYEGRVKDLGNTEPGDGPRYKGRGPIQLTGRANYRAAGRALNLPLEAEPHKAAQPDIGFRTAGWFWTTKDLNKYADSGDFKGMTRRINGGLNGLADRERYHAAAKKALGI